MPRQNTYRHYDLNTGKNWKKNLNVKQFYGVDYNKAQLNVADNHAVDIQNIIYKDKVNQKRNGWQKISQMVAVNYYVRENGVIDTTRRTNTVSFNGVWRFLDRYNQEHVIAHIGRLLFAVHGLGKGKTFFDCRFTLLASLTTQNGVTYNITKELNDAKSQAFYANERLYILGGNKYYVLKVLASSGGSSYELNEVEDDLDTYVPTTTIGIVAKDSIKSDKTVESSLSYATSLDDVNLLTQFRKNKLVTGTYVDDGVSLRTTRFWDYELDSSVHGKRATDINDITITISSLKEGV